MIFAARTRPRSIPSPALRCCQRHRALCAAGRGGLAEERTATRAGGRRARRRISGTGRRDDSA